MPRALSEDTNFVLWWLWYLAWASAADIARVTYLTEGAVSNILNRRRKQGWLLSARLGRVFDAVDRFVFSNTGVQEVQTKWGWQVFWWHSPASLCRLARRLEVAGGRDAHLHDDPALHLGVDRLGHRRSLDLGTSGRLAPPSTSAVFVAVVQPGRGRPQSLLGSIRQHPWQFPASQS